MDVSKRSGYRDFAWAIELNRLGLELIGLWPRNDAVTKNTYASDLRVAAIFVTVTFVSGIPLVCSLVRVWGDMILMIDNLQVTLPLLVVSLKLVVMRRKRSALLSIVNMMAEDWTESRTGKERDVMIGRAQISRAIVISGYSLMVLAFTVVAVLPYFGLTLARHLTNLTDPGEHPLPLQTYYFYDTDRSPQYELTFVVQAIAIFLAAVTYTSVDAFLGLVILHFCGQLENFKGRVAVLASCQNFIRALSNGVSDHLRLVRFASIIEDTFALMMLGLVFYFGIVFCLHGFLLITVITEENSLSFQRLCFPLMGITILLSHTFLYCGAGEIVTMHCERVYRALCDLEWYNLKPREAKALILLMIRANQPFRITAGKILPLTMATFCSVDFEWAVKLNRITLNIFGLWPKSAESPREKLICNFRALSISLGITFVILIPAIHSLIIINGDIMLMLDNLQLTLPGVSCVMRLLIFWWKKEAIVPIVDMIAEDWTRSKSTRERDVMIRRATTARLIFTCAHYIMAITCFFVVILPCFGMSLRLTTNITDPGRPMPLQTHYIYDVTKTPQYELTYITQSIYVVLAMMSYTGIDNFLGLLVFHICGQLDILNIHLAHLGKYVNLHTLKYCVARHNRLLRFDIYCEVYERAIAIIDDAYNMILLGLLLYFAILFAFYGFRIIHLFDEETDLSLGHLIYFGSTVFNIFVHMCLYCALGEILLARSNEIYNAAYNNKWYSVDPKNAKDLLPLLIRGAKPSYLTAGKVFPMTMATFCSLLKTSAGYISVLHTTRK